MGYCRWWPWACHVGVAWCTIRVPLITRLSLVMPNDCSEWRKHFGSLADHFASSCAIFTTLAICLVVDLALLMVWLTIGCLSEIMLHIHMEQPVSAWGASNHAEANNVQDSLCHSRILLNYKVLFVTCSGFATFMNMFISGWVLYGGIKKKKKKTRNQSHCSTLKICFLKHDVQYKEYKISVCDYQSFAFTILTIVVQQDHRVASGGLWPFSFILR